MGMGWGRLTARNDQECSFVEDQKEQKGLNKDDGDRTTENRDDGAFAKAHEYRKRSNASENDLAIIQSVKDAMPDFQDRTPFNWRGKSQRRFNKSERNRHRYPNDGYDVNMACAS